MNLKKVFLGALGVKALAIIVILLVSVLPVSAQEEETETFELGEKFKILEEQTMSLKDGKLILKHEGLTYVQEGDNGAIYRTIFVTANDAPRSIAINEFQSRNAFRYKISYVDTSDGEVPILMVKKAEQVVCAAWSWMPPSEDWCEGGKIVTGRVNEHGCELPPRCAMPYDEEVIIGTVVLPSEYIEVELGRLFELAEGEAAHIAEARMEIEVLDLDNDEAALAVYIAGKMRPEISIAAEKPISPPHKELKVEIRLGEGTHVFGYVINFEKTDGKVGAFSVKEIRNPTFSKGVKQYGWVKNGKEMPVEKIQISPGAQKLRVKNPETHVFEDFSADLEEGISIPIGNRDIKIKSYREKIKIYIEDGETVVSTQMPLVTDMKGLYIKNEDGEEKLIKVMPSVAAERAKEVLGEKFDEIEIKDVGKPIYEAKKSVKGKMFGLFPMKMQYLAQIDAESGDVVVKKPWYKFLTTESPQDEE
ncbi:hypothetical protein HQ533_00600 [Candidatus Woesearchaeota archaeon]|nr:hypothetical protein [Candidatus Woesearchaeota archaeon]